MLHQQLLKAHLDRLRAAVKSVSNVSERQILMPAKANHLALLRDRPADVVALRDRGADVNGRRALRSVGRASLHLVVRGNMPSRNRIRFACIFLDCRREEPNLRPTATSRRISPTYKAGALPLSYNGWASTRNRTEVVSVKDSRPNHWTIEAITSGGIRTHEV